jgi:bacterial/archaeal transporter family-2 protein
LEVLRIYSRLAGSIASVAGQFRAAILLCIVRPFCYFLGCLFSSEPARMPNLVLPALLAMLAGASVALQQVLNANLRAALNSAAWSGFVSYALGVLCMALLALALRDPVPSLSIATRVPWWAWSGGLFGAIFIALGIVLVPQLGAAAFIAFLIAGQMIASVAFDHFGIAGLERRPIDLTNFLGIALLIGGVILIRR